jgi:alkylation response protein AidB-like acyl-CoA dehydrogenase
VSTFRWKKTRKTKGAFYESMAQALDRLHEECDRAGCKTVAAGARTLNKTIDFAHDNRLTRHQQVMFALADMMTHVEVADSMAQLAVNQADDTTLATARVFANACARLVAEKARLIAIGSATVDAETAEPFLQSLELPLLTASYRGLIDDMDLIADRIFGRAS